MQILGFKLNPCTNSERYFLPNSITLLSTRAIFSTLNTNFIYLLNYPILTPNFTTSHPSLIPNFSPYYPSYNSEL